MPLTSTLSAPVSPLVGIEATPLSDSKDLLLTGPRGGLRDVRKDPDLTVALQGVTSARTILYDPENPARVVLRQGKNGQFGPTGGVLELGEHPVECAVREAREESRVRQVPELRFLTVQICEGKGMWLSLEAWQSWGYDLRGRLISGNSVWVASIRTAVFFAPLTEPFGSRYVEGRTVQTVDLEANEINDLVRPMFRSLMHRWVERLSGHASIPPMMRISLPD